MSASTPTTQSAPAARLPLAGTKGWIDPIVLTLFTSAIFTSATLLFVVQPMVGKILLPKLGGAPSVWNTCMVFFQATLLAGYLSAHLLTKHLQLRTQVIVFCVSLLAAGLTLPLSVGNQWVEQLLQGASPNVWLLSVLLCRVAPVFLVLSMTSPLLQKWFAMSGHPSGHDPYFLYAASNVGSILALLAYPFVIEVSLGIAEQSETWMLGFGLYTLLITICGVGSWFCRQSRGQSECVTETNQDATAATTGAGELTAARRAYWVLMAFIPSSLMLGVTTYISTDVASIPLIWVVPLAIYLLTFVFAFSSKQLFSAYWMGRIASLLILAITITIVGKANDPPTVIIPMHLIMFFTVAMFCHQRLSADRPDAKHLTDFYLWLSVGGVLGGLFNALLAPSLFTTIIEYPLIMIVASYLRTTLPQEDASDSQSSAGRVAVFAFAIFALTVSLNTLMEWVPQSWESVAANFPLSFTQLQTLVAFGIPAAIVLHNLERRAYFTMGLAAVFSVSLWNQFRDDNTIQHDRNFYGTIATASDELAGGKVVKMFHGNTVHGWQWTDPDRRGVPLTYYGKSSGISKVITGQQQKRDTLRIGAIGLGTGTLTTQMRDGDTMVFYEINPQVIAHAEEHFTYLSDGRSRGVDLSIRTGDARLVLDSELRSGNLGNYDIMVVDAFSSDSIPVHLVTLECLQTYLKHTKADGVIAFHISNRYLNLEPVLAGLAEHEQLAGYSYKFYDIPDGSAINEQTGETKSVWILMARSAAIIESLPDAPHLAPVQGGDLRLWTDDFTNVMSTFTARF